MQKGKTQDKDIQNAYQLFTFFSLRKMDRQYQETSTVALVLFAVHCKADIYKQVTKHYNI